MPVHDVGHAVVVSTRLPVSDGVGVISLSKCCGSIGGTVPFTRYGWFLPNMEGSYIFINHLARKSVRVHDFTGYHSNVCRKGYCSSSLWGGRGAVLINKGTVVFVDDPVTFGAPSLAGKESLVLVRLVVFPLGSIWEVCGLIAWGS